MVTVREPVLSPGTLITLARLNNRIAVSICLSRPAEISHGWYEHLRIFRGGIGTKVFASGSEEIVWKQSLNPVR